MSRVEPFLPLPPVVVVVVRSRLTQSRDAFDARSTRAAQHPWARHPIDAHLNEWKRVRHIASPCAR